jgi:2-haloacid dehalogenase
MKIRALIFDAYGTLFDVHSITSVCDRLWPGKGAEVSRLWRAKQLEYTWLRSLMGRYENFGRVTEAALRQACAMLALPVTEADIRSLMKAYLALAPFPETGKALADLKTMNLKLAILSNGSPAMLRPLVAHAGLNKWINPVLSVDPCRIYNPAPAVYRLAVSKLRIPRSAIGFVSSNCWDACGAKSFGFRTFWVNRTGAPADRLGVAPDHVIRDLSELPGLLGATDTRASARRR